MMENKFRLSDFNENYSNDTKRNKQLSKGPFIINHDSNSQFPLFELKDNWTSNQKLKFFAFLQINESNFMRNGKKQKWKLFKDMAKFIKTRNFNQCRNYFIKINRQFGSIKMWGQNLINSFQKFQEEYFKVTKELEELEEHKNQFQLQKMSDKQNMNQYQDTKNSLRSLQPLTLQNSYEHVMLVGANLFANYGQNCNNSSMPINIFKRFYPSLQQKAIREAEFRECHRLFLAWCQKVSELMQMEQMEKNMKNGPNHFSCQNSVNFVTKN